MSVPRSSDVSKHLARSTKRKGIILPFPIPHVPGRDGQMNQVAVTTEEPLLVVDLQTIQETDDLEPLPETR